MYLLNLIVLSEYPPRVKMLFTRLQGLSTAFYQRSVCGCFTRTSNSEKSLPERLCSILAKLFLFYLSEEVLTQSFFQLGGGDHPHCLFRDALFPTMARGEALVVRIRIYLRLGIHSHMTPLICYVLYICRDQCSKNKCLNKSGKFDSNFSANAIQITVSCNCNSILVTKFNHTT